MEKPLIKFNPKLPKLSKNEQSVLKLLVEAAELIAPIYQQQEKQIQVKVNKKELEIAAKRNPNLLSPYTIIEKSNGKLVAIPYHIKYAPLLNPIADKLNQACKITDNKEFGRLLMLQAKSLIEGSYEEVIAASIKMKPYILDISISPLVHFDYQVFSGKAAYQAWVGVLDLEVTKRLNDSKNIILGVSRKALVPGERIENFDYIKVRTIDEILLAGLVAKTKFVGLNLPMDLNLVKKYGSEVTLFNQVNSLRLKEQIMPTFKKIFSPAFQQTYTSEDLRRGSLRYVALHELAHNYLFYKNSAQNLQNLFHTINELAATLLGMRMAGSFLLKDRITSKQLESMIVAFVSRSFDLIEKSKKNKLMVNYALGGAIFINYMLECGAIKQKEGMAITNFTRIFLSLHELSYIMERLLASGTKKDAEAFTKKYGRLDKIS